jgi:hypothetical protein
MDDFIKDDKVSSRLPELTKSNWLEWSDLLKDILESKDLLSVVESTLADNATDSTKAEFKKNDAKARAIIKTAAGSSYRVHLLGLPTARACIQKLKGVCETTSEERVQSLLSTFYGMKFTTSIDTTASKLTTIQNQVKVLSKDEAPTDTAKKTILLKSLGEEYRSTVFALKAAGLSKLSFDDIVQRLKETEYGLEETEEVLARAVGAKYRPKESNKSKESKDSKGNSKRDTRCFYCKKPGHLISECRIRIAREKETSKSSKPEEARTVTAEAWTVLDTQDKDLKSPDWVLDSGCSQHITFDKSRFVSLSEQSGTVTVANRKELSITGKGIVKIELPTKEVTLSDVLYVPEIGYNLLSIGQLADNGISTQFSKEKAEISRNGSLLATSYRQGRSYVLKESVAIRVAITESKKSIEDSILWHRRLGHPGNDKLVMAPRGLLGLPSLSPIREGCQTCELSKAVRRQNREPVEKAILPLTRVYIDFWGPYKYKTIAGNRYILTITDDYSRKSWIELTKTRDEVYDRLRRWRSIAELESKRKLEAIRVDNAKEFLKLKDLFEDVRIETTTPYTPEQNGVAERQNRTLTTLARSLLGSAKLPKYLWGEAIATACYLRNRTPRKGEEKTPEELFTGTKPSGRHLRVFGCLAYILIPREQRDSKLDNTAYTGIFIGYSPSTKQYRVFDPRTKAIKLATSVRFDEGKRGGEVFYPTGLNEQVPIETVPTTPEEIEFDLDEEGTVAINDSIEATNEDIEDTIVVRPRRTTIDPTIDRQTTTSNNEATEEPTTRYPTRDRRGPKRYTLEARKVDYSTTTEIPTPTTYNEAVNSKEKREWKQAIDSEINSLFSTGTLEIVTLPKEKDIKLIGSKWVFKLKLLPNGRVDKFKARLVGKGYSQRYGIDYFETFSPVVRLESLMILLAIAAIRGLVIHQMDVVTAYLEGPLDEEIYLQPPEGLDIGRDNAIRLKRGLYGLKQSGRNWNKLITTFFEGLGLYAIPADQSVFISKDGTLIVALYVDDLLIMAKTEDEITSIKRKLTDRFNMKDLGIAKYLLGIRIDYKADGSIVIDQKHYIEEMLREFDLEDIGRSTFIPAAGYTSLTPREPTDIPTDNREYQRLIGKLNWLVRATRADIAFATQRLSQYSINPTKRHLGAALYILKYLGTTRDLAICFDPKGNSEPIGYADSDYAADSTTRKSTMGYVFTLANGPISWSSKLQRSVSTSTTEAEYISLCYASKEAVWIKQFLEQIYYPTGITKLYGDNQASIALVKNPEFHSRTKHLDVALHYVRELAEDEIIAISYCPTKEMLADCLTKPLPRVKHTKNVKMLGYKSAKKTS